MEYITANGTQFECLNVTTTANKISFVLPSGDCEDVKTTFSEVTEIEVSDGTNVYGTYTHLTFEALTLYADDTIKVVMNIPSAEEIRLADLEASQAEQDELIAEMLWG